jgi:hypothetical protein
VRNYVDFNLLTFDLQLWRPDTSGNLYDTLPTQFVAETNEELDYISERYRQDFDSPGFQQAVIANAFTVRAYCKLSKDKIISLLQILASQTPWNLTIGNTAPLINGINTSGATAYSQTGVSFDWYLITQPPDEIIVLDSPRKKE